VVSTLLQDLRYTARGLARSPGLTTILLLIVGLGTGINATVFSLIDRLLFRAPPGVLRPASLVVLFSSQFGGQPYGYSSYPDYLSLKAGVRALESLAAVDDSSTTMLRRSGALHDMRVARVSPEYFPLVGVRPVEGELSDVDPSRPQSAVISNEFRDRVFGPGKTAIGQTLTIDEIDYTVIGILPHRFTGLHQGRACDVWIPLSGASASDDRGYRRLSLIGRLARGATIDDVREEVGRVSESLAAQYPDTNRGTLDQPEIARPMTALGYSRLDPGTRARTALLGAVLFGATALVLLSATAGAGGLLLSRATSRAREIGLRYALGAKRSRLVQQLLTEALVVALAGGVVGLLFSRWSADALPRFLTEAQAAMLESGLDVRLFVFSLAISLLAGTLLGLAPAVLGTRLAVVDGGARLRALLVVGQIALSIVVLVAAMQLVRSLTTALKTESGATAAQVAVASLVLPGRYVDELRSIRYQRAVLEQLTGMHGVEMTAWVSSLPLSAHNTSEFRVDRKGTRLSEYAELSVAVASSQYFDVMRIDILAGRGFDERDSGLSPPVVVVNDVLAYQYFGNPDAAVGGTLLDPNGSAVEIVGVVESAWYRTLQPPPDPVVYFPSSQRYVSGVTLVVRTSGPPAAMLAPVREILQSTDKRTEIIRVVTLDDHLSRSLALERLTTILVAGCGLTTIVLAIFGVYGVVTDGVLRRTRELGIRVALGARPGAIVRLVFVHGLRLAVIGAVTGLVFAFSASYLLQSVLHGAEALDLPTLVAAPSGLALLVLAACMLPVRRALAVNPTVALRDE
jgi:predicted permease